MRQIMKNMQKYRKIIYFCIILILINGIAAAADRNVIIGFKKPIDQTDEKFVKDHGGKLKQNFSLIPAIAASVTENNISEMKKDPRIAYIEDEQIYNATDEYTNSWGVQHINSMPVHDQNVTGKGVNVAILDTGMIYNHSDLINNYKGGYNFYNNSYHNNSDPWDDNCQTEAKTCHGTHVAGIVAADKNDIGVIGVAPDANLYAVKVLHASGSGETSKIIAGLQWAVDNHMNIASMSFGGSDSQALHDAVINAYDAGVLLIASAGNNYGGSVTYPAAYTDSVIAVSATDPSNQIATFSSIGPEVEIASPGSNIYSTVEGGYDYRSGTSMAAPHVAGVAALIYSTNFQDVNIDGLYNNKDVRLILHNSKDLGTVGRDNVFGYGLADSYMAVFGIPVPTPVAINIILQRTKGSEKEDIQSVNLSKGTYSTNISSVNLTKVEMKVYENGVIQKRLSREFNFTPKRKYVTFDLTVNDSTVAFIPSGKIGSIGYVTIKNK